MGQAKDPGRGLATALDRRNARAKNPDFRRPTGKPIRDAKRKERIEQAGHKMAWMLLPLAARNRRQFLTACGLTLAALIPRRVKAFVGTTIIFSTPAAADAILNEVCRMPGEEIIEGAGDPVWVWWRETAQSNTISQAREAASGTRVAMCHPFTEVQSDWILHYGNDHTPGSVTVRIEGGLPADWKYPAMTP